MSTTGHPGAAAGSSPGAGERWEAVWRSPSVFADDADAELDAEGVPVLRPDSWRLVGRRFPLWVLSVVLTVGVVAGLGLLLRHPLGDSPIVRFDERLAARFEEGRTSTLTAFTGAGNFLADTIPVAVLLLVAMIVARRVFDAWNAALYLAAGVGGEKLSYYVSTLIVGRPRPDVETIGQSHATTSFPSGHVGSAVSLYGCLAVMVWLALWRHHAKHAGPTRVAGARTPDRWVPMMALLVAAIGVIVALSRMYRGFHFLTDVVVGAAIGVVWVLVPYGLLVQRSADRRA